MTKTVAEIQTQIDKLQAEANELRKKERPAVIQAMKESIALYGITAKELGLAAATGARAAASKPKAGPAGTRYADGKGNTWVGRGKRPQWLRDALAQGHKLEEFTVSRGKRAKA